MYVIGTAGHVDHGKSTLVKSLTGIDPDRLKEEREREMTTDLGFAWLQLPNGVEISVIDVPGHERFVKNMLAGVGGMDLVVFVVAADEGVQQQTREHLAILDLLGVRHGIIAITKCDLVDTEWLDLIEAEIEELLETSSLNGSPIARCSAVTQDGLSTLVDLLVTATDKLTPQTDAGKPRLWIDRSFSISGFGSVVTGTLTGGSLQIGQEIQIIPTMQSGRIRGLQTHNTELQIALPGSRVAVNISGLSRDDINRGNILTTPGWLKTTKVLDVSIRIAESTARTLKHNTLINFYSGTAETTARIRLLESEVLFPGEIGWAQLRLENPLPLMVRDLFILRSGDTTLAGGTIIDTNPKRHRKSDQSVLRRLRLIATGSPRELALVHLKEHGPLDYTDLRTLMDCTGDTFLTVIQDLTHSQAIVTVSDDNTTQETCYIDAVTWKSQASTIETIVQDYHRDHPLRMGISKEEIRARLGWQQRVFLALISEMCKNNLLIDKGNIIATANHSPLLSKQQELEIQNYILRLQAGKFSPPTDNHPNSDLIMLLIDRGEVVKLNEEVIVTKTVYDEMVNTTINYIRNHGDITVGQARDLFGTSRKYVLAFLEYLDQLQITRRSGEGRVLIGTTE